jgi:hypothetical protein
MLMSYRLFSSAVFCAPHEYRHKFIAFSDRRLGLSKVTLPMMTAKSISLSSSIFGVMWSIKNQKLTFINRKSKVVTSNS